MKPFCALLIGGQVRLWWKKMYKHILAGCRTKPLASYLKALGILRLVAEQKDAGAQQHWDGEHAVLLTSLTREEMEDFFCNEYAPTPIVAPWNGGSGFYLGDAVQGMQAIEESTVDRFARYREVIAMVKSWPEIPSFNTLNDLVTTIQTTVSKLKPGKKALEQSLDSIQNAVKKEPSFKDRSLHDISLSEIESLAKQKSVVALWKEVKKSRTACNTIKRNENKSSILSICRARLPESCLQWLDAVYALHSTNEVSYNPIFGTGGNEGRLELSNTFMQRVAEIFIHGDSKLSAELFRSSVFGAVVRGLYSAKIGQYDPGRAGGYNQGMEIETKDFKINPWDFVLAVEGALVLSGAIVRINPTDDRSYFTAPFTVRYSPVGFFSSASGEVGQYETWLPIWRRPAAYPEVKYLFGEGRSTLGRKIARTGIEFSRATGTLGVERGIDAFERYAYLQRRGQSKVALPIGRIGVGYKPALELLNELDGLLSRFRQFFNQFKTAPASFQAASRAIDEAIFECTLTCTPSSFCNVVRAMGRLEQLIAIRDRSKPPKLDRPLFGLSPRWVLNSDDGSCEVRLAAALASIKRSGDIGPLRSYMAGVDPASPWKWAEANGARHWHGSNVAERLAGVMQRRMTDASRRRAPFPPTDAALALSSKDVMPFLFGEYDGVRVEELLWGFSLIDWNKSEVLELRKRWDQPLNDYPLPRSWCVLKLLHLPGKIRGKQVRLEPRIVQLIAAGRIRDACDVAVKRLYVSELHPFRVLYDGETDPMHVLASLLVPVQDQWRLEALVLEKQ